MKFFKLLIVCSIVLGGGDKYNHSSICCKRKQNESRYEQIQKELSEFYRQYKNILKKGDTFGTFLSQKEMVDLCGILHQENELLKESTNILLTKLVGGGKKAAKTDMLRKVKETASNKLDKEFKDFNECKELKQCYAKLSSENLNLKNELKEMHLRMKDSRKRGNVEGKVKEIKYEEVSKIVALTNDINEKKNEIVVLQKCLQEAQQKFEECDNQRKSAEDEKIDYSNRFAIMEKEQKKLEAEIIGLHSSYSKEVDAVELRNQEIAQDQEELKIQIKDLKKKMKEEERTANDLRCHNAQLEKQILDLEKVKKEVRAFAKIRVHGMGKPFDGIWDFVEEKYVKYEKFEIRPYSEGWLVTNLNQTDDQRCYMYVEKGDLFGKQSWIEVKSNLSVPVEISKVFK